MSDTPTDERGPVMICATRIIKPPPTRIGQLGSGITLPRTIPLKSLISGGLGAVFGLLLGAVIGSLQTILFGAIIGGFLGVIIVTWSPVKGETLFQWITVNMLGRVRQRKLDYDGGYQALYLGVARLHRVAFGYVRVTSGAVNVNPDQIDERGVVRTAKNRNELTSRPRLRDLPGFQPIHETGLPEEVKRYMGAGVGGVRRTVGPNAPQQPTVTATPPTGPTRRIDRDAGSAGYPYSNTGPPPGGYGPPRGGLSGGGR